MSEPQPTSSMMNSSGPVAQTPDNSTKVADSAKELVKDLSKPEQSEQKTEEIDYSSRFAALSRREKNLLDREKKLKDFESQAKEAQTFKTSWEQRKSEMKKNPDLIFEELGMSFDDVINFKLGIKEEAEKKNLDPNELYKKIKQDIEEELENKFKSRDEEENKKQLELQEQENALIISNFKQDIENTLKSQSDKYELINYQGDYGLVFDVIENYFNEHNEVLPLEEAADHVESYLESLMEGATKLKKIQAKFTPKAEPTQSAEKANETKQAEELEDSAPKTLSNVMQATSGYNYSNAVVNVEDSKRRAAALLRWK